MRHRWIVPVLASLLLASWARAAENPPPKFESSWGSYGSSPGQFAYPTGVTADASGYLYVVDTWNDNVQKFTAAGAYVTGWGGTQGGAGDGEFSGARGIEAGPGGVIYVADSGNNRIQKFSSTGAFLAKWGTAGTGDGEFNNPVDVAVDASGNVYVSDSGNQRIQKFTAAGGFVTSWSGSLGLPQGIAVDGNGTVYVADVSKNQVVAFGSDGSGGTEFLGTGQAEGQVQYPTAVSVDAAGNVYVIDRAACAVRCRVQKCTPGGAVLSVWGSVGTADGQFQTALDVATIDGSVYVSDLLPRIQRFSFSTPVVPTTWGRLKTRY